MAKKIDEILSESASLSEEDRNQIVNLWESRVSEAKEEISATLREEFARKYAHDKAVLAETMDRFLTDKISVELEEFKQDRNKLLAEKASYKQKLGQHTKILDSFITEAVAKEVKELHGERRTMKENFGKLENFLLKQLSEEIHDFRQDKKALAKQQVKLVAENKAKLQESKTKFIKQAAKIIESNIDKVLRKEMTQFKDDIRIARENEFGRKLFESFAAEYMTTYLNENTVVGSLQKELARKGREVSALRESLSRKQSLVESVNRKLTVTQDLAERQKVMSELLAPLSKDKKEVMKELLESVETAKLHKAYDKYLPSVLNETHVQRSSVLSESALSTVSGNRVVGTQISETDDSAELRKIMALAGISK